MQIFLVLCLLVHIAWCSQEKAENLYQSLDPTSVRQHFALHQLYPETEAGRRALKEAWQLLSHEESLWPTLDRETFSSLVELINLGPKHSPNLDNKELASVQALAKSLGNRQLAGHDASSEDAVLALAEEDIDIGRALLLSQLPDMETVVRYEAALDLMALQIRAKLKDNAPETLIRTINAFIFHTLRFRFPPESLYADAIDTYTFLPSVIDGRQGVCLGVSALYLCLADRLGLSLTAVTPPGHIFVRWQDWNIETTARGIRLPEDVYLGINTRHLPVRSKREVVGLTHMNQASLFLQQGDYLKACAAYQKARRYIQNDSLLHELYGYSLILGGKEEEGHLELEKVFLAEHLVASGRTAIEVLNGQLSPAGLESMFLSVDNTRQSILTNRENTLRCLQADPHSFTLHFQLAITHLQLGENKAALQSLKTCHSLFSGDPTCEYYLAVLYTERRNLPKAWEHLKLAEAICHNRAHFPKALRELRHKLFLEHPLPKEKREIRPIKSEKEKAV